MGHNGYCSFISLFASKDNSVSVVIKYLSVIIILFHFLNLLPAYYCLVKIFLPACNFYSFLTFLRVGGIVKRN